MFGCKHDWQVINEVTLPSGLEQSVAAGLVVKTAWQGSFSKTHSVILSCKKCGKLHRQLTVSAD